MLIEGLLIEGFSIIVFQVRAEWCGACKPGLA